MANLTQVHPHRDQQWRVELSQSWDFLGPFPIHAREQQYLSPSFPLNCKYAYQSYSLTSANTVTVVSEPLDLNRSWPSSYADGGRVTWSTTRSNDDGNLKISFPNIRWKSLRVTEGWAALQHHTVLHTSLIIHPPKTGSTAFVASPHLLLQLQQGSYITILPTFDRIERSLLVPEWHTGNMYDIERALPRVLTLPIPPSMTEPTNYDIFVSGDYEIRLFGDPLVQGNEVPTLNIHLIIEVEVSSEGFVHEPTQDVVCDFVDGFAFGDAIGIGIRSIAGWWTVTDAVVKNAEGFTLNLPRKTRIAPSQTRIVPFIISQTKYLDLPELQVEITMISEGASQSILVSLPVKHFSHWTSSDGYGIKASYFYAQSMPSNFIVIPPAHENEGLLYPPILALHGAGVDVLEDQFWTDSMPRNDHSWVIIPTGRTSWGLDWHGPSALDAWSSVDALYYILMGNSRWNPWRTSSNTKVVILGHSNGGQGAWYLASRYPDRVLGVVPAAGYIKSQAYVPLTMSRSAHFIDPALRAILQSSLHADDNDLFLSNLIDVPILAIHGGDDENVPVWHSREAVSILEAWSPDANVTFHEDPGEGHWYPSVFDNEQVRAFLKRVLTDSQHLNLQSKRFTLTVSNPAESGSLRGWQIEALNVPGRLARLCIEMVDVGSIRVVTSNVNIFSVDARLCRNTSLHIDNTWIHQSQEAKDTVHFEAVGPKIWQVTTRHISIQASTRLQDILKSPAPVVLIPSDISSSRGLSEVLRIAHDLNVYHKLDAEIIPESEALSFLEGPFGPDGNIVFVGDPSSNFPRTVLNTKRTPFGVKDSYLTFNGQPCDEIGSAAMFLHPHPTNMAEGTNMLFILATEISPLERAIRLFPLRTGVALPSWLIVDSQMDSVGAAGVKGAGVWSKEWNWNHAFSWLY